ncbi:hypothetical protein RvY_16892-2 [Ramazzottius varieornatus]|uniref:G-protein coupled receptors family 2 profile 2 domain-containing protein n=1 Tax=Ramazzottius varieornatus TaxID=947166 RepID=A0A1D1W032_RAMVA|nr:hypothetical protein RvY_16892-2 [Ramazzottius varieornatus]
MDSSEGATAKDIYLSILRDLKGSWSDLSLWQQKQIEQVRNDTEICHNADDPEDRPSCLRKAFSCYLNSWLNPREDHAEGVYCPVTFDGHKCWEKKLPGRSVAPCADIITEAFHTHCQTVLPSVDTTNLIAYRDCGADGHWLTQNGNYTACKQYFDSCLSESGPSETHLETINGSTKVELLDEQTKNVVVYVFTGLAVTSVILLSISFFIFTHFKTLYCNRNSIHKNLCAALLLHVISLLVILSPRITGDETIYGEAWLCKSFMFLSFYAVPASIMWTFVEGLYLSQRLTLAVFKKEAPFKLYYFIGWGFPLVLAIAWALATEYAPEDVQYSAAGDIVKAPPNKCWSEYSKQPYHWIITGPCLVALVVSVSVGQQTPIH